MIIDPIGKGFESQSNREPFEVWNDGWLYVMPEAEENIREYYPNYNFETGYVNKQLVVTKSEWNGIEPEPITPEEPKMNPQIAALSSQYDILEDCVIELASVVYS